ncbi:NAD(P)-binding oxidoreductase [Sphingopyxis sp.]|jgi:putative NADH-flavin reductase|uniref:NAD(P)-dependent oxidoreductase n=1 Tax=Sphingopyxis sp. TaxID=1908224 RepID=UPI002DEE7F40|nr:NAD(P)-binding oxidoreductase [Sphingopyxis sp.]
MRLFVAGASGRVGQCVVAQALNLGHEVTALVRRPDALPVRSGLTIVAGEVAGQSRDWAHSVRDHDAVISTLGNPLWLKGLHGPAIVARAFDNLTEAMWSNGVSRFVTALAWGTGMSRKPAGLLVRAIAATLIRRDYKDFDAAERLLDESGLDWTIAYFGALTDAPASGGWSVTELPEAPRHLAIARADVAAFLIDAATVAQAALPRRAVLSGAPA